MFKFGDIVENGWASDANPTKRGYFVRKGTTPRGQLNSGPWIELTDGKGKFWRLPVDSKSKSYLLVKSPLWPIPTPTTSPLPPNLEAAADTA